MSKRVELRPYDSNWTVQAAATINELKALFVDEAIALEHIGSTAVPGLCSKPVIDLLLGASSLSVIEAKIRQLAQRGFEYVSKYEKEIPMRRYFVRAESTTALRVHLHGVIQSGELWQAHLKFRDALRNDNRLRDEYAALKQNLANQFANDKAAYTDAKAPFIQAILQSP